MARHKLLDIMGDLALIGRPLQAKVTAYKPGHTINNKVARKIVESL
jgi:UDP-3-O-[3-hydroxymyristoyl] N-acetylglucosamine deacetylase/3-hydroxyacyl-[acyl-carrier-protein] dehydratase